MYDLSHFPNLLTAVLDGSRAGILIQNQKGEIVYANRTLVNLLWFKSPGDLIGNSIATVIQNFDVFTLQGQQLSTEQLPSRQLFQGATNSEMTLRVQRRTTDEHKWIQVEAQPVLNKVGETEFAITRFHDVSEQYDAELKHKESEERFSIMADAAPVLLWMSGPDNLCYFFNKPWLEFRGRTLEQEIGTGWREGVHPDDVERYSEIYRMACAA